MPLKNVEDAAQQQARSEDPTMHGKSHDAAPATLEEVEAAFAALLRLPDFLAVKAVLAAAVANRFDGADPVWLLLVAPSASAKTEFVNCLATVPGTHLISQVTVNTFLSGWSQGGKKDPSLLTRLGERAILLQKDFTTIISMRPDSRAELLAQLREIYDGNYVREFGTGITKSWKGKMGFVSGVTLEVEQAIMTNSRLGDRFLYYRLPQADDLEAMRFADGRMFDSAHLRKEIQEKAAGYLRAIDVPQNPPPMPANMREAIIRMCSFIVRARAPVIRDQFGSKDIVDVPIQEGPTRFYKEIASMAHALDAMNAHAGHPPGTFLPGDWTIISKLAFDAIPRRRMLLLEALYDDADFQKTQVLAEKVSLPTRTVHMILDELECCGCAKRKPKPDGESSTADEWRMPWEARELMSWRRSPDGPSEEWKASVGAAELKAEAEVRAALAPPVEASKQPAY